MKPKNRQRSTTHFERLVWNHYRAHRRDLPWRKTRDPYKILVSEIMLQQTQVSRVILFYEKWMREFPDFKSVARAPLKRILLAWQGLGYNRRALALKKTAEIAVRDFGGILPHTPQELEKLPGVGPYSARAISVFAWNRPYAFLETNIRTVFIHHFFPRKKKVSDKELTPLVHKTAPWRYSLIRTNKRIVGGGGGAFTEKISPREWYFALMDYGVHLKKTVGNSARKSAAYRTQSVFKGSNRELRAGILKKILDRPRTEQELNAVFTTRTREDIKKNLAALFREGMIQKLHRTYTIT